MHATFRYCLLALPFLLFSSLYPAFGQREGGSPPTGDPFQRPEAQAVSVGNYRSHTYSNGLLTIQSTDGGTLRVQPWAEGVVRVEYFPKGTPVQSAPSISVVQAPEKQRLGPGKPLHETPQALELPRFRSLPNGLVVDWNQNALHVIVSKKPLRVSLIRGLDTLTTEAGGAFQRLPGALGVSFRLAPDEHLYGTGSRALPLDRRGRRLELYNQAHYGSQNNEPNLNITLPVVVSSRGYMLFFDRPNAGYLDLGAKDKNVLEYGAEELGSIAYFIIAGNSYAEILNRYTALTGRQPLPPRWAMGLIQSRFGYKSDTAMYQVAGRMRREGFPLDALVLDLYWFGGTTRQGNLDWDYAHFPHPAQMMRRLDSAGVKTILISEPYVMRTSRNDSTVRTRKLIGTTADGRPYTVASFWAGPASILDVAKPSTRDWLWSYYKKRKEEGAAGWWSDLGEPENQPADMLYANGPTRQSHNAYGQLWASIFTEKYAREFPNERVFNLARSGWAGMQRNGVFPWSGDINRSWSGLQAQVPVMLGMALGGVGYMHSDAGGFCVGPVDPELYTRWLQMAALCPILRPHGEGVPPEAYWYPEPYKSSVRRATHLRYELLPYLYTLAWENSQTGTPLARPMNYADSEKEALANVNDQYLLGPNLLVVPVLSPSQRRRNVLLPEGNWVDFYTNQTLPGNQTVGLNAPLAHIPLLVRAGAFLPMTRFVNTTAKYRPDTLQVRYYADPSVPHSSFTMYEDDGKSAQVTQTIEYQLVTFTGDIKENQAAITVAVSGKGYPGAPARRVIDLLIPRVTAAPSAAINGKNLTDNDLAYDAATQTVRLRFVMGAQPVTVSLRGLRLSTLAMPAAPVPVALEAPDSRIFSSHVQLNYTIHTTGQYVLTIRDAAGRVVQALPTSAAPGQHSLVWNATDHVGKPLPGGVYTAELSGERQRLILIRE